MIALVVVSNIRFAEAITYQLNKVDMECVAVSTAANANTQARVRQPDLLIIHAADVHSGSQIDGLVRIRRDSCAPIILIGDLNDTNAQTVAERLGPDDFASYPASAAQLMKSVRRVLWRKTGQRLAAPKALDLGDIHVDLDRFEARVCGRGVPLSITEMEILYCLGVHANRIVSRETLLNYVWCCEPTPGLMLTINSHMRGLREKIEPDRGQPRYLITKRGVGYMLSTVSSRETAAAQYGTPSMPSSA